MALWSLPSNRFRPRAYLAGAPGPWAAHIPFACDLIASLRPAVLVEIGTYYGDSYFGFCQAIVENLVECTCYAVDTWKGDPHGGFYGAEVYDAVRRYNEANYASFSYLLQSTFDEALTHFSDESVDLLHIDGFHTYEAAKHDFENWFPKVRPGGIVLLHDVAVRHDGFGLWRLWEQLLKQYPTFLFRNSNGLGVLRKPENGNGDSRILHDLFCGPETTSEGIRRYYSLCAERLSLSPPWRDPGVPDRGEIRVQAFYCMTDQYRQEHSVVARTAVGEDVDVVLQLPDGIGNRELRIDPADRTGIIKITELMIENTAGDMLWKWTIADAPDALRVAGTAYRLPVGEGLTLLSYDVDPQIYLPALQSEGFHEALNLRIHMKIDTEFSSIRDLSDELVTVRREAETTRSEWAASRDYLLAGKRCLEEDLERIRGAQIALIEDRERVASECNRIAHELATLRDHPTNRSGTQTTA